MHILLLLAFAFGAPTDKGPFGLAHSWVGGALVEITSTPNVWCVDSETKFERASCLKKHRATLKKWSGRLVHFTTRAKVTKYNEKKRTFTVEVSRVLDADVEDEDGKQVHAVLASVKLPGSKSTLKTFGKWFKLNQRPLLTWKVKASSLEHAERFEDEAVISIIASPKKVAAYTVGRTRYNVAGAKVHAIRLTFPGGTKEVWKTSRKKLMKRLQPDPPKGKTSNP